MPDGLSTWGDFCYREAKVSLPGKPNLQKWTKVTLCHHQHFHVAGGCTHHLLLFKHSLSPHHVPYL